jgi:hypothetical protein
LHSGTILPFSFFHPHVHVGHPRNAIRKEHRSIWQKERWMPTLSLPTTIEPTSFWLAAAACCWHLLFIAFRYHGTLELLTQQKKEIHRPSTKTVLPRLRLVVYRPSLQSGKTLFRPTHLFGRRHEFLLQEFWVTSVSKCS